jgi:hypothetical protein
MGGVAMIMFTFYFIQSIKAPNAQLESTLKYGVLHVLRGSIKI